MAHWYCSLQWLFLCFSCRFLPTGINIIKYIPTIFTPRIFIDVLSNVVSFIIYLFLNYYGQGTMALKIGDWCNYCLIK